MAKKQHRVLVTLVVLLILIFVVLITYPRPHLKEKYILISIHDATPFYKTNIDLFLAELEKRGIQNFTILVTPDWGDVNINEHPEFVKTLLDAESNGAELALHGYDHKGFEFLYLSKEEAGKKLNEPVGMYVKVFGSKPAGFVPPYWMQSVHTDEVLEEEGFRYYETMGALRYFSGDVFRGLPITMVGLISMNNERFTPFATKVYSNAYARIFWNNGGVVRYSIHPQEAENGNFNATLNLLDGFLKRGWKPVTYSELEKLRNSA